MRLVLSWLREFVDVPESAAAVAQKLALCGFEVASVEDLGGTDAVIDFEVTANRPDCLSVVGLAREVATAYDRPLTLPSTARGATVTLASVDSSRDARSSDHLKVAIDDAGLCPRYVAALADVSIAPSPAWMTERLL